MLGSLFGEGARRRKLEKAVNAYVRTTYRRLATNTIGRDMADRIAAGGPAEASEVPDALIGLDYVKFAVDLMGTVFHKGGVNTSMDTFASSCVLMLARDLRMDPDLAAQLTLEYAAEVEAAGPADFEALEGEIADIPPERLARLLRLSLADDVAERIVAAAAAGQRSVEPTDEDVQRIEALVDSRAD